MTQYQRMKNTRSSNSSQAAKAQNDCLIPISTSSHKTQAHPPSEPDRRTTKQCLRSSAALPKKCKTRDSPAIRPGLTPLLSSRASLHDLTASDRAIDDLDLLQHAPRERGGAEFLDDAPGERGGAELLEGAAGQGRGAELFVVVDAHFGLVWFGEA